MKISTLARTLTALSFIPFAVLAHAAELPPLPQGLSAPSKPAHLPQFTLATPGGGKVRAEDYKGKVLIARFWATW